MFFDFHLIYEALAQASGTVTVSGQQAVTNAATNSPQAMVAGIYQFALMIGGLLAFGAIIYSAIKYALSAGNPTGQGDARSGITDALLGLLLLMAAYLILNTINPNLTKLYLPPLQALQISTSSGSNIDRSTFPNSGCLGSACVTNGCWSQGGFCINLAQEGLPCKSGTSCSVDKTMLDPLKCLGQKSGNSFQINESYPPTTAHNDPKHYNGCAVDIAVKNFGGAADCQRVNAILQNVSGCGLVSINEYTNCGGRVYDTTIGNNIHLDGCRYSNGEMLKL